MAKRSPILGYNHNVLYRGLVFHVQTEDSGQLSPHLFTHLFHGGVIISSRKLVYDAGSAEDAIKGLMQSQHKIVLKDLKRGTFDDKIDAYLVGTEGLLPRSSAGGSTEVAPPSGDLPVRPSASDILPPPDDLPRVSAPEITITRPDTEEIDALDAIDPIELIDDQPSAPNITIEPPPAISRTATPPPLPRTKTADRKSGPSSVRTSLPPPPPPSLDELDPPTNPDVDSGAIAAALNATVKTTMPNIDSAPEISIKLDLEAPPLAEDEQLWDQLGGRTRSKHDTEVQLPSDGVPGSIGAMPSSPQPRGSDSIPPLPAHRPATGDRIPALGAASLPPARPISRPPSRQAITPPGVVSRPIPASDDRSEAVEIYAPPPGSAEPPPGERAERPGQYAQHKKPTGKPPVEVARGERTGSIPIPSGLSRPGRPPGTSVPAPSTGRTNSPSSPIPARAATPSSQPNPRSPSQPHAIPTPSQVRSPSQQHPIPNPQQVRSPSQQHAIPRVNTPSQPPPPSGRTPTPSRVSPSGPTSRPGSQQSGGVVMTRPAVIVGAPAKPAAPPRVRKAREEEGRGFGQGLISEKSLDEVILAYLSEDADDK